MLLLYKGTSPKPCRYIIIVLLAALLAQKIAAQDILSSQWMPMKAQLHPALTGRLLSENTYQAGVNHRQQWASISDGYQTSMAFIEKQQSNIAWGAQLWQQSATRVGWQDNGLSVQLAFHQKIDQHGQRLSAGLSLGGRQRRGGNSNSYDQQYVAGSGFDSSLSSGEEGLMASRSIFDWSASFAWSGGKAKHGKDKWLLGLTAAHLHQPDFSLTDGSNAVLATRWSALAAVPVPLNNKALLLPIFHFQQQGPQQELRMGAQLHYKLNPSVALWGGGQIRYSDANIWQCGIKSGQVTVWMSYDWNTSALKSASQGKGAFELGLSYEWSRNKANNSVANNAVSPTAVPSTLSKVAPLVDSDMDGVPDKVDRCPLVKGIPAFSGCNDLDKDGVIDPDDSCPELFGYPDQNGCPYTVNDSDLDGVPDEADYCIYIKGDPALHGCPDTDQDGISDIDDKCPFLKGTPGNKGCPTDEKKQ